MIPFISLPLDAEMNPRFDIANHAFMFTYRPPPDQGVPSTWCLRFNQEESFTEWKDQYTILMWEGKNKMSYAKAKVGDIFGPADNIRRLSNAISTRRTKMSR